VGEGSDRDKETIFDTLTEGVTESKSEAEAVTSPVGLLVILEEREGVAVGGGVTVSEWLSDKETERL